MTSLPTPAKRRLTYQVSVRKRDKWSVASTGNSLDKAIADARGALGTGKVPKGQGGAELHRPVIKPHIT